MASNRKKSASADGFVPSELTAEQIEQLDGASNRSNAQVVVYDVPVYILEQIHYAIKFVDTKYAHVGVDLFKVQVAAYEQFDKGGAPLGQPNLIAWAFSDRPGGQAGNVLPDNTGFLPYYALGTNVCDQWVANS